jgi:hypothetical protein
MDGDEPLIFFKTISCFMVLKYDLILFRCVAEKFPQCVLKGNPPENVWILLAPLWQTCYMMSDVVSNKFVI